MKIGILTLPFNNNYGGYLQAYALYHTLEKLGHTPEVIYRRANKKTSIKRLVKAILGTLRYRDIWWMQYYYDREKMYKWQGQLMKPFVDKYITRCTSPLYSTSDLQKKCQKNKYEAIIVGSDQVWRPEYAPEIENYFINFIADNNINKIAYAASFGTSTPHYTSTQINKCGELIKKFKAVSIRESSGFDIIKKFKWICTEPKLVLDPTMLLTPEDYLSLCNNNSIDNNTDYAFCYILDNSLIKQELIKNICHHYNTNPNYILGINYKRQSKFIYPSIETWITSLNKANIVITDSFHGMVFSIIFNKPFFVFVNKDRGQDRFTSLLSYLDLTDRIITDNSISSLTNKKSIEWTDVNKKIKDFKLYSLSFLKENLDKN